MKEPEFIISPGVETELGAIWARIATHNPDAANHFIEAAYETFATLARAPEHGRPRRFRRKRLGEVRSRHISGLDNYLIFYRPMPDGIHVLHLCDGARDVEALMGSLEPGRIQLFPAELANRVPSAVRSYSLV